MRFPEIFRQYCTDNNIEHKCGRRERTPGKCRNIKLRKLALYFNKDENEFVEFVDQNPNAKFRELLAILKEKEAFNFDPQDKTAMKKMKCRFRRERE